MSDPRESNVPFPNVIYIYSPLIGNVYDADFQVLCKFTPASPLPFCDRGREATKKEKKMPFSIPTALVFLPIEKTSSVPPLAVLLMTQKGREIGRKDLAVFGLPTDRSYEKTPEKVRSTDFKSYLDAIRVRDATGENIF